VPWGRMRKFALLGVTLLLGAAIVGASTYPQWGSLWRARAIAPLLVYSTESDAAYSGAINRTVGAPIASLSVGDSVAARTTGRVIYEDLPASEGGCFVQT